MQIVRLVRPGKTDLIVGFDELPTRLLNGIESVPTQHYKLGSHWVSQAKQHYVLDFVVVNKDKEAWQNISNFVKRSVDRDVRLLDKIEDMAIPMASNSKVAIEIGPEDIPVIKIPLEYQEKLTLPTPPALDSDSTVSHETEKESVEKRRGRPPRVAVSV